MSSLTVDHEQKWVPTHVQVTVLRARGVRGKGKHGTSDVYTIIQLGKEKYSTCVAEKTTAPEWREECTFELQPSVLESGSPAGSNQLVLTVMHQALMGLDLFLGQAVVPLEKVFSESRCLKNEWYQLKSKTGKKEKERGDIQVTVQFTRDNLTASMYDLVMKDKSMSTFGKLKERMRGKKRSSEEDSSSSILPGGYGSLCRMRQRLPSEGGGEEDYEDDEGGEVRRSKMRTFFLRGKLRKSSDTRSSTSLGSESSESSSRGGSLSPTAGISVVVSDLSNSPSNSSNLTTDNSPEHTANLSPRSPSSLQCEFGDEVAEISIAVLQPTPPVTRSQACSVPPLDPGSGKPPTSLGLGLLHKSLPLSTSLQNLNPRASMDPSKGPVSDGRRWSFDKPGEEEKAAIAAALEQSGPMLGGDEIEERLGRAGPTKDASVTWEAGSQGKKLKRNLLSHGRGHAAGKGQNQREESEQSAAVTADKHKGWFGSKDSPGKPSPDPSTDFTHVPLPTIPPVGSPAPVSPLHHTNPFTNSHSTLLAISPCNPFFSLLQQNPFYDAMLPAQPLKPSPPPLPFLSSSRPPISHLFPQTNDPNGTPKASSVVRSSVCSNAKSDRMDGTQKRPLPPTPAELPNRTPSNPFTPAGGQRPDAQWDDFFEAFAAGRLQPPGELSTDRASRRGTRSTLAKRCSDGALPPSSCDSPHGSGAETRSSTGHLTNASTTHFDGFAQFLETIPEHNDGGALDHPAPPLRTAAHTESDQANGKTHMHFLTNANMDPGSHHPSAATLSSSSPDPASSGIGSSVEEDFLSCLSSHSDKFSASSAEESEAQNLETDIISFEKSCEPIRKSKSSESEDDRSNGPYLLGLEQNPDIQRRSSEALEGSVAPSPGMVPVVAPLERPEEKHSDLQPRSDGREEFPVPVEEFPPTHAMISSPPDVLQPTFHIQTSSPAGRQNSAGFPAEEAAWGREADRHSPIPCGDFPVSPSSTFSPLLLPPPLSDRSSCCFLHSLYLSSDSQNYQSCESPPSPNVSSSSEPKQTPDWASSTLAPADAAQEVFADASTPSREESQQSSSLGCSCDFLPPAFTMKDESCDNQQRSFTDQVLPAVSDDRFCPHAQTLQRSHSDGSLKLTRDQRLCGADFPALPSSAPLTPDHTSPSAALSPLPPFASATAGSPPSMPQAAAPSPVSLESQQAANQQNSPHPVKPLLSTTEAEEKRNEGRSVLATGLEKLKFTIHPGRSSQLSEQEANKRKLVTGGAGSYYHLNHNDLVALLVQREAELEEQREEFERQKCLLAKREVELKKLKPQVKDLEDYIDTLLVRIMEQKPTLLQEIL
eukprot:XP_011618791.1 PREDICTED: uncharacterized protein LOC101070184 isoform X2 [Takifugu rubripes]